MEWNKIGTMLPPLVISLVPVFSNQPKETEASKPNLNTDPYPCLNYNAMPGNFTTNWLSAAYLSTSLVSIYHQIFPSKIHSSKVLRGSMSIKVNQKILLKNASDNVS